MSKRIALQKYGQLNERAVRYDADCPRVLQRVAAHWNTYIERVIKQRNPEDREKVVAMAKEGPAAFYIFLVTDLLWRAWRTHSPSMEASIQSIHMKIGFDNQYLWNMKELAEILPK